MSGWAMASRSTRAAASDTSFGVAAGTMKPPQGTTLTSGMPASAMVGTSGIRLLRSGSSTTSGRNLPSFSSAGITAGEAHIMCTRPPSMSCTACDSPLYGAWVMSSPAEAASCAPASSAVLLPEP